MVIRSREHVTGTLELEHVTPVICGLFSTVPCLDAMYELSI